MKRNRSSTLGEIKLGEPYRTKVIVLLGHYRPSEGKSMALYRQLVTAGLTSRGYKVVAVSPPILFGWPGWQLKPLRKWLGYIDQFVVFPIVLTCWQLSWPQGTKVIILDQALGPWVPFIRRWPALVVCHDLLALRASRGEFREQRIGTTGKIYQRFIRRGFRQGHCFAAVSQASHTDLNGELTDKPAQINILLNPLPDGFYPIATNEARLILKKLNKQLEHSRYVLHIGGYWYKNREGVCRIFLELLNDYSQLKLVLVGHIEAAAKQIITENPDLKARVIHVTEIGQTELNALYSAAEVLLFPSWHEGFGWPVLEALACGCPVITTNRNPMREVGGEAATYIPACPHDLEKADEWAKEVSIHVESTLNRQTTERSEWRERGIKQAAQFNKDKWLDKLESILSHLA